MPRVRALAAQIAGHGAAGGRGGQADACRRARCASRTSRSPPRSRSSATRVRGAVRDPRSKGRHARVPREAPARPGKAHELRPVARTEADPATRRATSRTREILPRAAEIDRSTSSRRARRAAGRARAAGHRWCPRSGAAPGMDAVSLRARAGGDLARLRVDRRSCRSRTRWCARRSSAEGDDAQSTRWLPAGARARSSAASRCPSRRPAPTRRRSGRAPTAPDGDGWVLNGTKNFITNGPVADV